MLRVSAAVVRRDFKFLITCQTTPRSPIEESIENAMIYDITMSEVRCSRPLAYSLHT
jgi:hypothetical protein